MKLHKWIYETLPVIYFVLGYGASSMEYGMFSAAIFFVLGTTISVARYSHRKPKFKK